jgi:sulfonate transport system substrate-binding protein
MAENRRSPNRTIIIVAVVCFLIAAGYAIYLFTVPKPRVDGDGGTQIVRIGTFSTAIDYAPMIVAKSKGWLAEELGSNAKLEWTTFQTLPTINESFAAGKIDVVFEAEVPAIVGRSAGIDLKITDLGATLREGIIVPVKSPVQDFRGLKGKRIAVLSGTAMHYGFLNLLQAAGVDKKSVNILNMTPPDAAAAFSSGQLDAWAVWPPWPEQQVVDNRARFLPGGEAQIQSVVVMRGGFIQEQRPAAQKVLKAIQRAKQWLAANPEEGINLVAKELNLPVEVVRLSWPKHDWNAQLNDDIVKDLEAKSRFLVEEKMVQNQASMADLILKLQ